MNATTFQDWRAEQDAYWVEQIHLFMMKYPWAIDNQLERYLWL